MNWSDWLAKWGIFDAMDTHTNNVETARPDGVLVALGHIKIPDDTVALIVHPGPCRMPGYTHKSMLAALACHAFAGPVIVLPPHIKPKSSEQVAQELTDNLGKPDSLFALHASDKLDDIDPDLFPTTAERRQPNQPFYRRLKRFRKKY